jgi:glycosyltransferase involved in cell wall biosynthesis
VAVRLLAEGPLADELRELGTNSPIGFRPDVALLNSAPSAVVALELGPTVRVIAYVHEEGEALKVLPDAAVEGLVRRCDRVLCVSESARHDLLAMGVAPDRLDILPPSVRTGPLDGGPGRSALAAQVGADPDRPIVVGCGEAGWRKGADLFVQLATEVRRRVREPVYFIWVGGDLTGTDFERVRSDIDRAGADHVNFVGVKPDPVPWFAMADVFALTSHEDPFPLVCLEHAAMGHPIVTYRNVVMPELLEDPLSAAEADAVVGRRVYVERMVQRKDLNRGSATVLGWNVKQNRWEIEMDKGDERVLVRSANLGFLDVAPLAMQPSSGKKRRAAEEGSSVELNEKKKKKNLKKARDLDP